MTTPFVPPPYSEAPDTQWSTADLCDRGLSDASLDVRVLPPAYRSYGGRSWYFGEVLTVAAGGEACSLAQLLAQPGRGRVLLADAAGADTHAVFGDRMAAIAVQHGWAGLLVHGHVRDTRILMRMPLGVHALGAVPNRQAIMSPAAEAAEVTLHGHRVRSGEWLYADEDGVIVMARRHT